jgi:N-acetylmuramic acid 6-phosphate etherase
VIGCAEQAAVSSRRSPWFLYCNPDEVLRPIERSRRVLESGTIEKISLFVGPMALSGSTRMQASTVLQLGIGLALLGWSQPTPILDELMAFAAILRGAEMQFLAELVVEESRVYEEGGFMLYEATDYGITIVTDTTERSPTFSLLAFENTRDPGRAPALCYFHVPGTSDAHAAWVALLGREPRTLEWDEVRAVAGRERLLGFDFSDPGAALRASRIATFEEIFRVARPGQSVEFELVRVDGEPVHGRFSFAALPLLFEHLLLKIALNIHSTLVMGRLGRYETNLMTYVRPSNKKLVDRTIRYVRHLLEGRGFSYEEVARAVFAEMERSAADEPIVLRVVRRLNGGVGDSPR